MTLLSLQTSIKANGGLGPLCGCMVDTNEKLSVSSWRRFDRFKDPKKQRVLRVMAQVEVLDHENRLG